MDEQNRTPKILEPGMFDPMNADPRYRASAVGESDLSKIDLLAGIPPSRTINLFHPDGSLKTLMEIEAEAIAHAIKHLKGNMSEVARTLGIGRSTLYRKVEEIPS